MRPARVGRVIPIVLIAAMGLCGCAEISQKFAATASQAPYIGMSPEAPARPAAPAAYPAVHDMPADRNSVMLTEIEQQKLESDLTVARDRQQAGMVPQTDAKKDTKKSIKKKAKLDPPPKVVPVSSRGLIY